MSDHSFIPIIMNNAFPRNISTDHDVINDLNTVHHSNQYIINKQQQQQQQYQYQQQQQHQQQVRYNSMQLILPRLPHGRNINNNQLLSFQPPSATIYQQPMYQQNTSFVPITLQLQPQQHVIQQLIHPQPIIHTRNNNKTLFVANINGQILGTIHQNMVIAKDATFDSNNNHNLSIHHIPTRIDPHLPPNIDLKIPQRTLPTTSYTIPPTSTSQQTIIHKQIRPQQPVSIHTDTVNVASPESVRYHTSNTCDTSNTSQLNPLNKSSRSTNGAFVCSVCSKQYKYLCNYKSHFKIHTDDCYKCEFCGKKFGRKSNYREHVRVHTGESPFECHFCQKRFKQRHGWKDHLRVHTGEKPYQCDICNKRFSVGHNLNVHKRIHTGQRPFDCNLCNKSFRQKSAFNSHAKNIHGVKKKG